MTTSLDQIRLEVEELGKRFKAANTKKSSLSGLLQAKREELAALKKEIEEAGYDPKKLREKRDELLAELQTQIETLKKQLASVEEAYEAYERR